MNASELHRLHVFATIVDQGSMTAAAVELGISRSAVSAHLSKLEGRLGVRLLERTTRRMSLTLAGEEVYGSACAMVDAARGAVAAAETYSGQVRGPLRVACPIDLSQTVLLPVIRQLRANHPALRIEALVSDERVDLIGSRIDVAMRLGEPADSTAIMRRFATTEAFVVAAPELAARFDGSEHPSALSGVPRVSHRLIDARRVTLHHPDGREVAVLWDDVVVSASVSALMRAAIVEGIGMGVLPELLVRDDLRAGRLKRVFAPWIRNRLSLYTLMPSRSPSPTKAAFHSALASVVGSADV